MKLQFLMAAVILGVSVQVAAADDLKAGSRDIAFLVKHSGTWSFEDGDPEERDIREIETLNVAAVDNAANEAADDLLKARPDIRWFRRSAEYSVIAQSIYRDAERRLREFISDRDDTIPWTVSVDADETILDNAQFAVEQIQAGRGYDENVWRSWVEREEAIAIPGAVDYLNTVLRLGGRVVVITNRDADQNVHTRTNLRNIGLEYHPGRVCVLGRSDEDTEEHNKEEWDRNGYRNDKDRRRRLVSHGEAEGCWASLDGSDRTEAKAAWSVPQDIVMYVGDNIQDLPGMTEHAADSPALLQEIAHNPKYVVLPNPSYGSWRDRKKPRAQ
jgi:predicted secreted acid phosphatase